MSKKKVKQPIMKVIQPTIKVYQPKRKQYNDLTTLVKEMALAGEKVINFNGVFITTKNTMYGLFDGIISITERG